MYLAHHVNYNYKLKFNLRILELNKNNMNFKINEFCPQWWTYLIFYFKSNIIPVL